MNYLNLFILLFFSFTGKLFAQTRLGTLLPDSSVYTTVSYSGCLYAGIENPIAYQIPDEYKYDRIVLITNNGYIFTDSLTMYTIPSRPGKSRIHVYGLNGHDTTELGYMYFTVKRVPNPYLTINNLPLENPTSMYKLDLIYADSIGIAFSPDIIGSENWVRIEKFELGYNYGGFYLSHINPSNKITIKTKQIISRIAPDRDITIRPTLNSNKILKEMPIYRITLY